MRASPVERRSPVSSIQYSEFCLLYSVFCIQTSVFCILYSDFCLLYSVFTFIPVSATFRRVCNPPGGGWGFAPPAADTLPCSLFSLPAFVVGSLTRRREAAGCKPAATCHPRNGALPYSLFSLPAFFCRVANPTQGRRRVANPPQRGRATWMPAWEATGPQLGVRNPPQRRVCSPSQLPRSGGVTPPVNFHVPAGLQPAG